MIALDKTRYLVINGPLAELHISMAQRAGARIVSRATVFLTQAGQIVRGVVIAY